MRATSLLASPARVLYSLEPPPPSPLVIGAEAKRPWSRWQPPAPSCQVQTPIGLVPCGLVLSVIAIR
jgi:hypothetical protein